MVPGAPAPWRIRMGSTSLAALPAVLLVGSLAVATTADCLRPPSAARHHGEGELGRKPGGRLAFWREVLPPTSFFTCRMSTARCRQPWHRAADKSVRSVRAMVRPAGKIGTRSKPVSCHSGRSLPPLIGASTAWPNAYYCGIGAPSVPTNFRRQMLPVLRVRSIAKRLRNAVALNHAA